MTKRYLNLFLPLIAVLACVLFNPLVGAAQERAFDCLQSGVLPKARQKDLLTRVQKSYSEISSIEARFTQNSYVDALEISEVSFGQVWFRKPGFMKWHYTSPSEQVFVVRDNTLWLYQVEPQQVIIDDFKETLISDLPVAFLLGIGNIEKDFSLMKACQNPEGIVLELAPAGADPKRAELKTFKLLVNPDSYAPRGAFVVDVGNNSTAMLLDAIKINGKIADEVFSSDFGKGLDISDRRLERRQSQE